MFLLITFEQIPNPITQINEKDVNIKKLHQLLTPNEVFFKCKNSPIRGSFQNIFQNNIFHMYPHLDIYSRKVILVRKYYLKN